MSSTLVLCVSHTPGWTGILERAPDLPALCERLPARGLNERKLPERLEIVTELPRNAMYTVVKRELRDRFHPDEPGDGNGSRLFGRTACLPG